MRKKVRKLVAIVYLTFIMSTIFVPTVAVYATGLIDEEATEEPTTGADNNEGGEDNGESGGTTTESKTGPDGKLDTGNAIADIMDDARFEGAISSINWLTKITDRYFTMAITLVAFFIISASLLKNACAGAYCANSKFWDKVHEAHVKNMSYTLATVKGLKDNYQNISAAGIRDFLLGVLPDIKALTVFAEDNGIEPKQYFMRAIPQMLLCVIIGVFIYNGYYRDTAATVGSFGAESFERVMAAADPVGLADKLFNMTGTPKVTSDYDTTTKGKIANKITKSLYTKIITTYTDVQDAAEKSTLIANIDTWAYQRAEEVNKVFEDNKDYDINFSVNTALTPSPNVVSDSSTDFGEDGNCLFIFHQDGIKNEWGFKSTKTGDDNVIVAVKLTGGPAKDANGNTIAGGGSGGGGTVIGSQTVNLDANNVETKNSKKALKDSMTVTIDTPKGVKEFRVTDNNYTQKTNTSVTLPAGFDVSTTANVSISYTPENSTMIQSGTIQLVFK